MQYKTHRSFANLLASTPELNNFSAKLEQLEQISQIIASKLDASLVNNCKVSNLRDGALILSTNSPAWHHKLRFCSLDILSTLRADPRWSGLKSIEIRVDYIPQLEHSHSTCKNKLRPLSQPNAKLITQLADNLVGAAPSASPLNLLAAALRKLAKRAG